MESPQPEKPTICRAVVEINHAERELRTFRDRTWFAMGWFVAGGFFLGNMTHLDREAVVTFNVLSILALIGFRLTYKPSRRHIDTMIERLTPAEQEEHRKHGLII